MYVGKSHCESVARFEGGVVLSRALASDGVLQEQLVASASEIVRDQESCAGLSAIVLKDMSAAAKPPVVLLQSSQEVELRSFLLRWYRLSEAFAGCCAVISNAVEFASLTEHAVGEVLEVANHPETQEETCFYPAYRLLERASGLRHRICDQGAAATACWCIRSVSTAPYERQLRVNLVRLQRSWVPQRVRTEQVKVIQNYLSSSLSARQFVVVPRSSDASVVRAILERDCAESTEPSGFSLSLVREHTRRSAASLSMVSSHDPCPGDAVESGFLLRALVAQIAPLRESLANMAPRTPRNVFISYSHKDREFAAQLATGCAQLRRDGWIRIWSDAEILAGGSWREDIQSALEEADLVLLLISPDFIQSDFCYGIEMRRALERHAEGGARVIPIVIRATDTAGAPFARLQMLPTEGKPVMSWPDRDAAWLDVARGLRRVLEAFARGEP